MEFILIAERIIQRLVKSSAKSENHLTQSHDLEWLERTVISPPMSPQMSDKQRAPFTSSTIQPSQAVKRTRMSTALLSNYVLIIQLLKNIAISFDTTRKQKRAAVNEQ
jgi:hypothetical protein